jgi:hypothetical protein
MTSFERMEIAATLSDRGLGPRSYSRFMVLRPSECTPGKRRQKASFILHVEAPFFE